MYQLVRKNTFCLGNIFLQHPSKPQNMVRRDYKNNPMLNGSDDGFQEALRIFLEGKNRRPGGSPLHQTLRHILF